MPQVWIELSEAVAADENKLLQTVNQALDGSGVFRLQDIKSRLYRSNQVLVGDGSLSQAFVYIKIAIVAGRSEAIKEQLAKSVLNAAQQLLGADNTKLQYGVEVVDLASHYQKL